MHHLLFYLDVWINEKNCLPNFVKISREYVESTNFEAGLFPVFFVCSCAPFLFSQVKHICVTQLVCCYQVGQVCFELCWPTLNLTLNPTCPFAHSDDHLGGPSKYIIIYLFTFILLSCCLAPPLQEPLSKLPGLLALTSPCSLWSLHTIKSLGCRFYWNWACARLHLA
jgi:hypothetical protein